MSISRASNAHSRHRRRPYWPSSRLSDTQSMDLMSYVEILHSMSTAPALTDAIFVGLMLAVLLTLMLLLLLAMMLM